MTGAEREKPRPGATPRAGRFEILGAWLGVWTPRRGTHVPPVPVRGLLLLGLVAVLVAGAAAAAVVPAIDAGKDRSAAKERREARAAAADRRRRLVRLQRPMRGRSKVPADLAGRPVAVQRRARAALVAEVERAITRDARVRVRTGELRGRVSATVCEPHPVTRALEDARVDLRRVTAAYGCLASVRVIHRGGAEGSRPAGALGYPFRAVVDFRSFSFVWCRIAPIPGEQVAPDPRTLAGFPRPCRTPR